MDKKLRQILEDFSSKLQHYEEKGGDLPEEIDRVWVIITDELMAER